MTDLPANTSLTFEAVAYDQSDQPVLSGSTVKSLSVSANVSIALSADVDISIFSVRSIAFPQEITVSDTAEIRVEIEGPPGRVLSYEIEAAVSGGGFTPAAGSATLDENGSATVVGSYTAPAVEGLFSHVFSLTDGSISVRTGFQTQVVLGDGSGASIVFNPWITHFLAGPRVGSHVSFSVAADDDKPVENLVFSWMFDGAGQHPTVTMVNADTAEAILVNYNENVTGTISVGVTDGDGGSTVLNYTLEAGLFPDCIVNCSVPTARAGSDVWIEVGNPVGFDGSASSDPNNLPLTYQWAVADKPAGSGSTLLNGTTASPSLTPDTEGTYTIQLTVHNGSASDMDGLVLNVASASSSVSKPTFKMTSLGGDTYKIALLSPTEYQSLGLTGVGGVSVTCSGLSTIAGFNGYSIGSSTVGGITVFSFEDLDANLTTAGATLDICSFSCGYSPVFSLTDSVSVNYEQSGTVSGTGNIDSINP
ncbi:MAG: PKD domain-containing protein [Proteobacteria bacterium]|nr:PKD domain-containing protein [Pseudomonadota bacterium]